MNIKEVEELGLVARNNVNDLLNDETLHSYFADADNFDQYTADIFEFFKQDILTINKLKEFLSNLGYGPKTIDLSAQILSRTAEDKAAEKAKNMYESNIKEADRPSLTKKEYDDLANKIWKDWKKEINEQGDHEDHYFEIVKDIWDDNERNGFFDAEKSWFLKSLSKNLTKEIPPHYDWSDLERDYL